MPATRTGLPFASRSWTTGAGASATPSVAAVSGAVVSESAVGAPAATASVAAGVSGVPSTVVVTGTGVPACTPISFAV